MKKISDDNRKQLGIKRGFKSFKYSFEGLAYAYRNEQSMLMHFIASVTVIIIAALLGISITEWIIIILCLALIMIVELFNTAIEAVVDLITREIHPLAKIAKDCGSAAAFIAALISFGAIATIFVPYLLKLL